MAEEIQNKDKEEIINDEVSEELGEDLELTPKEVAILDYLKNNPNEIVSRETIFKNVWNFDSKATSNVIDVHLKNLRKKFKKIGKENMIETVWGKGYRFSLK